ncbi:MAG: hypothetical protein DMD53_00060 [Gemmatimonadetes bacterium]|nr:MAG: hypothetical protein DMD53_00060 [Gemmatimonadota bacterium]
MERRCERFGLKLGNLPIFALRREFNAYHWLIAKPEFRDRLRHFFPRPAPVGRHYSSGMVRLLGS